ncbi:transposase, partial [Salinicoccus albus]|uniref:transposase n=1 Tax=Salinicoccus albus TaxID=418756 RepID=UPI0014613519
MTKYPRMSLIAFQTRFSTEAACENHLFDLKWPDGYCCDRCSHTEYYLTRTRKHRLYECRQCRYQASALVGTVMQKTRT